MTALEGRMDRLVECLQGITDEGGSPEFMLTIVLGLELALQHIRKYADNRADIRDGNDGRSRPNTWMVMADKIAEALAKTADERAEMAP